MIGVMVELPGEAIPLRHFYAVGQLDRAQAEWAAIDQAMVIGPIATSPVAGLEPVHMVAQLSAHTIRMQALRIGEVRALGRNWPHRWISA